MAEEQTPVVVVPEPTPVGEPQVPAVTPILGPILALLRSRKVMYSIVVFIVGMVVQAIPALQAQRDSIINLVAFLGLVVIGGISLEDAASYVGQRGYVTPAPIEPKATTEDDLREVINDILDERLNQVTK